jgi:uncharacterized protein YqgV (UPF0045/DUF77 family)
MFIKINSIFTDKSMLEKLIDDELLMIKSKELKIKVSNMETKAEVKKQKVLSLWLRIKRLRNLKKKIENLRSN